MLDSRRIVVEFDFPKCGDEQLSGPEGLMTKALLALAEASAKDKTNARGRMRVGRAGVKIGVADIRYVHSYYNSDNVI